MLPGDPSVKDGEKRLKRMIEKRLLQPESHQTSLKKPSTDGCNTVLWTEWMGISGWGMEHLTVLKTCVASDNAECEPIDRSSGLIKILTCRLVTL